jgi:hypothetical protein
VAALRRFAAALRTMPADNAAARLGLWQSGFVDELKEKLAAFHPAPPDYTTLPPELKNHLVSPSGWFALYIYPQEDLWNQGALERFVRDIEPRIEKVNGSPAPIKLTGIAHNIYHSTASIRSSFLR